ncbi:unnamed protein product [Acanthosepion pharaonis]|uniref:Uncharacterized protein n=1 Tax=Acanthosepion pharaonis TaxID=158019 RepID=A0A812ECC6_ACAPH|nr:unnamed protein product [Sepia pharaonis]
MQALFFSIIFFLKRTFLFTFSPRAETRLLLICILFLSMSISYVQMLLFWFVHFNEIHASRDSIVKRRPPNGRIFRGLHQPSEPDATPTTVVSHSSLEKTSSTLLTTNHFFLNNGRQRVKSVKDSCLPLPRSSSRSSRRLMGSITKTRLGQGAQTDLTTPPIISFTPLTHVSPNQGRLPVSIYLRPCGDQPDKTVRMYAIIDEQSNRSLVRTDTFKNDGPSFPIPLKLVPELYKPWKKASRFPLPSLVNATKIPNDRSGINPEAALHHPHLRKIAHHPPPWSLNSYNAPSGAHDKLAESRLSSPRKRYDTKTPFYTAKRGPNLGPSKLSKAVHKELSFPMHRPKPSLQWPISRSPTIKEKQIGFGFITGKAKLGPEHSVPRLELCAALLVTELKRTKHLLRPVADCPSLTQSAPLLGVFFLTLHRLKVPGAQPLSSLEHGHMACPSLADSFHPLNISSFLDISGKNYRLSSFLLWNYLMQALFLVSFSSLNELCLPSHHVRNLHLSSLNSTVTNNLYSFSFYDSVSLSYLQLLFRS